MLKLFSKTNKNVLAFVLHFINNCQLVKASKFRIQIVLYLFSSFEYLSWRRIFFSGERKVKLIVRIVMFNLEICYIVLCFMLQVQSLMLWIKCDFLKSAKKYFKIFEIISKVLHIFCPKYLFCFVHIPQKRN